MSKNKRYINNKDFAESLDKWKKEGAKRPIPTYIADCFLQIVNRYGTKINFSNYTYIEDMKSEALEHCVKYADRFNMEKSTNAFAYFTQITHNAFIQFINKEKKFSNMKFNMVRDSVENSHNMDYSGIFDKREIEMEKDAENAE